MPHKFCGKWVLPKNKKIPMRRIGIFYAYSRVIMGMTMGERLVCL